MKETRTLSRRILISLSLGHPGTSSRLALLSLGLAVCFLYSTVPVLMAANPKELLKPRAPVEAKETVDQTCAAAAIEEAADPDLDDESNKPGEPDPRKRTFRVLDVPHFCQFQVKFYDNEPDLSGVCCGPTSLAMVMNYYGKKFTLKTIREICHKAGTGQNGRSGTSPYDLAEVAKNHYKFENARISHHEGRDPLDWLKEQILKGRPVLISCMSGYGWTSKGTREYGFAKVNGKWVPRHVLPKSDGTHDPTPHSLVVVGFNRFGEVVLADPESYRKRERLPVDKFMAMWRGYHSGGESNAHDQFEAVVIRPYAKR
ncbi:MAG: hypothetical protein GX442_06780 [Candidatus Riflebacteria bacterium]|nr:hypothetical protein [Candidatus Riflebacteria bacterium]